jgi:hypothetical protein
VLDSGFRIIRIIEGDCRWEAASLVDRGEIDHVEGDVLVVVPVSSAVVALDLGG